MMKFADLLSCQGRLFLESITDAGDSRLCAVICIGGHTSLPRETIGKHLDEIAKMPIEYADAPYYELRWDRYFTFIVRDEAAAAFRRKEEYSGHGVREFRKSWLLGAVPELSNGLHEISGVHGPVRHFGIYCANHVVDIIAYEEPVVSDLGRRTLEPRMPNQSPEPTS